MAFKIVVDSCCDLPDEEKENPVFTSIPLTLHLDGVDYVDDETFDQAAFLKAVKESEDYAKTSCPAPGMYYDAFKGEEEDIYVVTLSSHLSGSYGSAQVAANMYFKKYGEDSKNIYIFDSKSACCGESQAALKIKELAESGMPFEEVVTKVEEFIYELNTYFVLETLDTLRKNGRLSKVQALVANVLNIKPVMGASNEGDIIKLDQTRGMTKALKKMKEIILKQVVHPEERKLFITHVNCPERAKKIAEDFLGLKVFKDVVITSAGGLSTCYANDGGIVIAV